MNAPLDPLPPLPPAASRTKAASALFLFGSAAAGAIVATAAVRLGALEGGASHPPATKAIVLAASLLGILLAIFAHELGHVLFGLSQGFRFHILAAGPVWIEKTGGRVHLKFNRVLATWGGIAACSPVDVRHTARRMAWMAIGGPVASLGFAAVVLGIGSLPLPAVLRIPMNVTGIASAGLFVVTTFLPAAGRGLRSDGKRARDLLRGDEGAVAESALITLYGLGMSGVEPHDWPEDLVLRASSIADGGTMSASTGVLLFQRHFALADYAQARAALVRAIAAVSNASELMIPAIATEAALFELAVRRDLKSAEPWLARAAGPFVDEKRNAILRTYEAELRQRSAPNLAPP